MHTGCSSLRGRKRLPLCCIKLDTATDDGYSGGNFERPGWKRMLNEIEEGRIGTVILKDACVIIVHKQ